MRTYQRRTKNDVEALGLGDGEVIKTYLDGNPERAASLGVLIRLTRCAVHERMYLSWLQEWLCKRTPELLASPYLQHVNFVRGVVGSV